MPQWLRYSVLFLSIQAQDFIEDQSLGYGIPQLAQFLSIQAQDFIEELFAFGCSVQAIQFLSIQAQDFIEEGLRNPTKPPSAYS